MTRMTAFELLNPDENVDTVTKASAVNQNKVLSKLGIIVYTAISIT
jgi:hypothetical protein